MEIPSKVKVGGKTYTVQVTDNLYNGRSEFMGEIDFRELVIRVTPGPRQRMEVDLLHELVHAVFFHLGHVDHDEKEVGALSHALHMVIQDNPEMFAEDK